MAAQSQVDAVLVEDGLALAVDHADLRGGKVQVPQRAAGAALQRDGPGVRVLDGEVLDAEVLDERQQDADVPPVAALALAVDAGVGAEGVLAERLAAVAGGAGMVGAFEDGPPDAADVDVPHGLDVVDAHAAVGAAEEVVAAAVGELDAAVLQLQHGVATQQDGGVEQPQFAPLLATDVETRDDYPPALGGGDLDGLVDPLNVAALEVVGADRPSGRRRRGCDDRREPAHRREQESERHANSIPA